MKKLKGEKTALAVRCLAVLYIMVIVSGYAATARAQTVATDNNPDIVSGEAGGDDSLVDSPAGSPAGDAGVVTVTGQEVAVRGLVVDVTADDAVQARARAINTARRRAFEKLAQAYAPADGAVQTPDDGLLSTLVQDVEIQNEQISANRYVATFNVRFLGTVLNFFPAAAVAAPSKAPVVAAGNVTEDAALPARSYLVLPYTETETGALLLWEEDNHWRKAWSDAAPAVAGWTVALPLGDISDIAAGSAQDVWSGRYGAIETLRANYGVEDVVLAVLNRTGGAAQVDVYIYTSGSLGPRQMLLPYTASPDTADFYAHAVAHVMQYLKKTAREDNAGGAESPVTVFNFGTAAHLADTPAPSVPVLPETVLQDAAPQGQHITVRARFKVFAEWVDVQKRLAAVTPPVDVAIQTLSSDGAVFTLSFGGTLPALTEGLRAQGLVLGTPVVSLDGMGAQTELYPLQRAE